MGIFILRNVEYFTFGLIYMIHCWYLPLLCNHFFLKQLSVFKHSRKTPLRVITHMRRNMRAANIEHCCWPPVCNKEKENRKDSQTKELLSVHAVTVFQISRIFCLHYPVLSTIIHTFSVLLKNIFPYSWIHSEIYWCFFYLYFAKYEKVINMGLQWNCRKSIYNCFSNTDKNIEKKKHFRQCSS